MQPFSAAAAFGCVQAHDSDYVSVYVHVHVHAHVHVHEGSDIVDVFVGSFSPHPLPQAGEGDEDLIPSPREAAVWAEA